MNEYIAEDIHVKTINYVKKVPCTFTGEGGVSGL